MPPWLDSHLVNGAEIDRRWALALHRGVERPPLLRLLQTCSRLGDGPMWLAAVVALLLIGGPAGARCAVLLVAVGGVNLLIYWSLKRCTSRARPFVGCPEISARARPLDPFSFPSGHTLHAVAFAVLLCAQYGLIAAPLWLFVLLVAASRVVLGLHYPSDVLIGAVIGGLTAGIATHFL